MTSRALTAQDIRNRKGGAPIVSLTAYTTPMARMMDGIVDFVLVGDSVGMVLHGLPSTLGVTLDMMVLHGRAVARGLTRSLMVVDLPFGSYEAGPQPAFEAASRLMRETGAGAVKLEGGAHMAETVQFLTTRGIPVMGHVGLTPQSVNTLGGYKVQGRGAAASRILADATALAQAGAFAIVLEKVPQSLADDVTRAVPVPTIGIGASVNCDGQVLVVDDMLGLFDDFKAKFVRRYADMGQEARTAIAAYAADVRARNFPGPDHVFSSEPSQ